MTNIFNKKISTQSKIAMCEKRITEVPTSTCVTHFREKVNTTMRIVDTPLFVIGHVFSGSKQVFLRESIINVSEGETYFLSIGKHYAQNYVNASKKYDELMITITSDDIKKTIEQISANVPSFSDCPCQNCPSCKVKRFMPVPDAASLPLFFTLVTSFIGESFRITDEAVNNMLISALLYILFQSPNQCIKGKILAGKESEEEEFKNYVYDNIFSTDTIETIASNANYSLSSFKKRFKSLFGTTPHDWVIRERLKYAKFLLRSSPEPIDSISKECLFQNPSHFAKAFKKEYAMSPTQYRSKHLNHRP